MIYNSNFIHDQQSQIKRGVGENNCVTARGCLRRETYATPISPFSILRLVWGVKVQVGALGLQKFMWLPKNIRTLWYSYLQALLIKHARYVVNSKIIQTYTYSKANRRIYGTLRTLPKPPTSFDGGDWLTVG